jgi:orotate phosphoribosyltransferase
VSDPAGIGAATARLLLQAGALMVAGERPFVLAGGWASPVYVDCRRLIGEPALAGGITDLMARFLRQRFGEVLPFDSLAGGETAGIPWAAWLSARLGLPMRYVRKRPLGIGRNAQVEGGEVAGQRVLLIDDLVTDGRSKVAFARGLRAAGALAADVLVLFYNRAFPGGEERLAAEGLVLHALADWSDLLGLPPGEPLLAAEAREVIEHFLRDPVAWSAAHEGRRADQG